MPPKKPKCEDNLEVEVETVDGYGKEPLTPDRRADAIANVDNGYKSKNMITNKREGYSLKPRQDLCVVRFTEFCTSEKGMLLLHNV
ncbi:MAG: hypothetical protein MUP82_00945 [Candidatus Marinimicrobia bacterium]|nr:hypothetical protein [Candidatus Neomarinimicrobiota bacterium]